MESHICDTSHITAHFKGNAIFEVTHCDLQRPLCNYKVHVNFYASSGVDRIYIEETVISPNSTRDLWLFYCPIYQLFCCHYTKIYTFLRVVRRRGDIPSPKLTKHRKIKGFRDRSVLEKRTKYGEMYGSERHSAE